MKKHLKYLKYVLRHKWFVFVACVYCRASLWRAIIHDWTKFLPCEWTPYVNKFYDKFPSWEKDVSSGLKFSGYPLSLTSEYWDEKFHQAWNHHQKSNKHHWQYWLLTNDCDEPKHQPIKMPEKYAREMVADWWGAGRAITGKWDAKSWYYKNSSSILLHPETRGFVESLLQYTACRYFN